MNMIGDNLAGALIVLGFVLLAVEVLVFSFSVFILFFLGLACIVSGALLWTPLLPSSPAVAFILVAFFTVVFAVTLWKPLKKMQNSGIHHNIKGDFIGHSFVLASDCSETEASTTRMSGVEWKVRSKQPIAAGTMVHVVKVEVGELTVAAR
jgi:membrane protein implicated in regulation of membrane protease activity